MKYMIILFTLLFSSSTLYCEEPKWEINRINLYIENDKLYSKDEKYTSGIQITTLYSIPDQEDNFLFDLIKKNGVKNNSYISFSIGNQIYTPLDTENTELVIDEPPYAGWSYLRTTIHKSSSTQLRSLSLKVGMIGPASGSEHIQNNFHKIINSYNVNGWEHQLKDELGINLKYTQKWINHFKTYEKYESSIIPYYSVELGNIATNASLGVTARIGWNIQKDFGASSINVGADPGVPIENEYDKSTSEDWGFSFNFTAAGSAVGRNIFLDGNTFKDSHSIDRKYLTGHFDVGFTIRHKNFMLEFMHIHTLRQYEKEEHFHNIGSLVLSWLY